MGGIVVTCLPDPEPAMPYLPFLESLLLTLPRADTFAKRSSVIDQSGIKAE